MLNKLKMLFKNKESPKGIVSNKIYNSLNINILIRPNVPIQYIKNCNDNLHISNRIEAYLNQYYFLLYIPYDKDTNEELSFVLDNFINHNSIYLISLIDLINLIYNYHTIDSIASMTMELDQFHILKDIADFNNKIKILNMLTENISCINIKDSCKINDNIFIHNQPDIDKIYYDYKSYNGEFKEIPEYLFFVQIRHEHVSLDDYLFIKNLSQSITVDSFKNLDDLNIQYTISYKIMLERYDIISNSVFKYLTKIDNLHYLSKFKDTIERNSIFKEIQDLDEDVDEIIEESELQDNGGK